ncbi:MAG: hypothetical protein R2824_05775 [Saprospiraceae bacterium]|nr:hypothetical protein [Lewinella sp.]
MLKSLFPKLIVTLFLAIWCAILPAQKFTPSQLSKIAQQSFRNTLRVEPSVLLNPQEYVDRLHNMPAGEEEEDTGYHGRNAPETNLTETGEAESEIHAAINPADTNNIIVSGMLQEPSPLGASLTFPTYYTKDFGQTWQKSEFNGVDFLGPLVIVAGGGDPIIVFEEDGTAHITWLLLTLDLLNNLKTEANLYLATSEDGGATWEMASRPVDGGEIVFSGDALSGGDVGLESGKFVDKEWMAVDYSETSANQGNIYIAYAELNAITDTTVGYRILVNRKLPDSTNFAEEPVAINTPDSVLVQFTSIDVDQRGYVNVLFTQLEAEDALPELYYSYSSDGAQSFSEPTKVTSFNLPCFLVADSTQTCIVGIDQARIYPCPHLRVDRSGGENDGNIYVVWTAAGLDENATTGLDIYYTRSTDGGASWDTPVVLNQDADPATDQFHASMAVNENGTVVIGWYDRRDDPNNLETHYYLTYSNDGGTTFVPDFPVTSIPSDFAQIGSKNLGFGIGEYTQIVTTGNYAIPFWADGRGNDGNIEIFSSLVLLENNTTTPVRDFGSVSTEFSVGQPTPNPAQDEVRLMVDLKETSSLSLRLLDIKGSQLQLLHQDKRAFAGEHILTFSVAELPAGIYTLLVETDFGFRTKRLVVE